MRINVIISFIFLLFGFSYLNAQTYNYSYTDPCTGNIKNIIVPIDGSVTVGYYGFIGSFTQQDFTNGTFETWANNVFSQFDGSPCSELVGLTGSVNIAQDVVLNTVGLLNSLSSLMDMGGGTTDFLTGSINSASNSSNSEGNGNNKKNGKSSQNGSGNNTTNNNITTQNNNSTTNNNQSQNNGTSNTNEGSSTTSGTNETSPNNGGNGTTNSNGGTENSTSTGGTTTEGGTNENGNQQAQSPINQNQNTNENNGNNNLGGNTGGTSGNGNSGNGENTTEQGQSQEGGNQVSGSNNEETSTQNQEITQPDEEGGGETNITQGATKTVNQNKEGGKPTVIASSDFVGFNFQNSEVKTGLKLTGGYHNLRWDGQTARGGMMDYVSAQQGPNLTGYHAWIHKKSMTLLSGTLSVGFEGRGSLYGTIAAGQLYTFSKVKGLKAVYMGTVSYGQVYKTEFLGTALIGGGMYDLKAGKRFDIKLMGLFVYAPYVSYYNDLVLKSPYVVLPSVGTNISITKRFKFNINAGGAWAIRENALNYTVTCGTRLLVGQ